MIDTQNLFSKIVSFSDQNPLKVIIKHIQKTRDVKIIFCIEHLISKNYRASYLKELFLIYYTIS